MALRRAIGAVKDQTSIGLAKVGNSNSLADLDVAIVKATRHEEYPAEDKYFREIVSLTCYSRTYISACVNTLSRRLSKTKNWVVALKTLMLIQRLLTEGDPAYEQEIFFTTRRGTRLLNMSDFRDTSRSNSWDYSAFVRTYASYLDDKLEFKMQGIRKKLTSSCSHSHSFEEDDLPEEYASASATSIKTTPIRDQLVDQLLPKMHPLQQLLERFLATRPAGLAKHSRVVIIAMYPIVKESFQIYYDITDILSTLIDQFMELEISDCVNVLDIFCRISKQFDELDGYYKWCKEVGIARASEYPEVERITSKKLDLMEEFIKEKAANAQSRLAIMGSQEHDDNETDMKDFQQEEETIEDMNAIKALPPPEAFQEQDDVKEKVQPENSKKEEQSMEADFLNLGDDAPRLDEHADKLALALFDGQGRNSNAHPIWELFNDKSDWETSLVESSSYLAHQKVSLGGGFDTMLLDGMYQQGALNAALVANRVGGTGSASSVAFGTVGNPHLLALPAPQTSSSAASGNTENVDPFAASLGVAPPAYVQMSELEKKQRLLVQEQLYWQQYQRDRMQGPSSLSNMQSTPPHMGGYAHGGYRF
ncbi:putative clathrin assembly protein At1g03050 [Silene latifolia]|uniref:putative clathrin assembly protein At1g03050 n=1 Tax=Silene latifolia TaxID=37657 RepID=UPI003D785D08